MKRFKRREKEEKSLKTKLFELVYLLTVGVMLSWVMTSGVVDTTIFNRNHSQNLRLTFLIVAVFGLFLINKWLTRLGFAILAGFALFIAVGFFTSPVNPTLANRFVTTAHHAVQFILGNRTYNMVYERFIIWTLIIFFSGFVSVFMFLKFNFWVLFITSVLTTSLAITSPYFMNASIFYVYIFCLLALVAKYLHDKNMKLIANRQKHSVLVNIHVPVVAVVVLLANLIPTPPVGFSEGFFQNAIRAPFDFFNDLFLDMTQQSEFSLRQVGFGGQGGRLGGNIEPNDDLFMTIRTTGAMPLYLTGATRDTYTGYAWINLVDELVPLDVDSPEHLLILAENTLIKEFFRAYEEILRSNPNDLELIPDIVEFWEISDPSWVREEERFFLNRETGYVVRAYDEFSGTLVGWVNNISHGTASRNVRVNNLNRRLSTMFHTGSLVQVGFLEEDTLIESPGDFYTQGSGNLSFSERLAPNSTYMVRYHNLNLYNVVEFGGHFGRHLERRFQNQATTSWDSIIELSYFEADGTMTTHEVSPEIFPALTLSYVGRFATIAEGFQNFRDVTGYELWQETFNLNNEQLTMEELLNNYFIPRVNVIHETYTQLPPNFPDRVRELAEEVTRSADNDYERMRLLETFLSTSFAYTLQPGPSPHDRDFVDHFLFDLQQGYCVHFATAFVTMARSLGMPTRYVEGFYINVSGEERRDTREEIDVLNSMAHAWAEVYFEGFGWHLFEPTPAAGLVVQQAGDTTAHVTPAGGFFPEGWGWEDGYDFGPSSGWTPPIIEPNNGGGATNQTVNTGTVEDVRTISIWVWIGLGVLSGVSLFIGRILYVGHLKRKRKQQQKNARAIYEFERLLAYLSVLGYDIKDNESAHGFANRIVNRFSRYTSERTLLMASVDMFTKARYSHHSISKEEYDAIKQLIIRLDSRLQVRLSMWQYLYYRYVLGKF